jgi:hypothetical protein
MRVPERVKGDNWEARVSEEGVFLHVGKRRIVGTCKTDNQKLHHVELRVSGERRN